MEILRIMKESETKCIKLTQNIEGNERFHHEDEILICGSTCMHRMKTKVKNGMLVRDGTDCNVVHTNNFMWRDVLVKKDNWSSILKYIVHEQGCHSNWYLFVDEILIFSCTLKCGWKEFEDQVEFMKLSEFIKAYNV